MDRGQDPDVAQLAAFWALAILAVLAARAYARRGAGPVPSPRHLRAERLPRADRRLAAADAAAVAAAALVSWPLALEPRPADSALWGAVFLLAWVPAWVALAAAAGHYGRPRAHHLAGVVVLATLGAWIVVALSEPSGEVDPDVAQLSVWWVLTIAAVLAARVLARRA